MPVAARLSQFLNRKGVDYQCLHHDRVDSLSLALAASGVSPSYLVQATLLIDLKGVVMAVHPYRTSLDLDAVCRTMNRRLQLLTSEQADRLFPDCESGMHPPLGGAYGVPVVVEEGLLSADQCYMPSGCSTTLLKLDGRGLRLALAGAARGRIAINRPETEQDAVGQPVPCISLECIAQRLQKLYRLPAMPAVALRILHLTSDETASANDLADLIERDPSLSAQIMRYASSALFNYRGDILNVKDAITRVLGFDRVAHIAMGVAASRAFKIPREGMLGLDNFWRHSLHCAYLCQTIAERRGKASGMDPGQAYLCGLLHNFGLLLIGHLFPPEFRLLNRLREANPEQPLAALEKQVFGMGQAQELLTVGHGAIGGILLKLWQLPDAVVKTAGVHQQPDYQGDHEDYVRTVQLANILLGQQGIGDEFTEEDSLPVARSLDLTDEDLDALMESTEAAALELDALAHSLAA